MWGIEMMGNRLGDEHKREMIEGKKLWGEKTERLHRMRMEETGWEEM